MGKKGPLWWRESDWLLRGSSGANQILLRHSGPILSIILRIVLLKFVYETILNWILLFRFLMWNVKLRTTEIKLHVLGKQSPEIVLEVIHSGSICFLKMGLSARFACPDGKVKILDKTMFMKMNCDVYVIWTS